MKSSTSLGPGNHAHDAAHIDPTTDVMECTESLYASLVENLPVYVVRKNVQGRITYVNDRLAELLGQTPSELRGKSDFDLFPHNLAQKYRQDDLSVMQTGDLFVDVEENISDGQRRLFEVRKTPVRTPTGRIVGVQAIFWDVTQRVRTEEALRYERFLLHTLMEYLPDSIYFKDADSRFVRVSRAMAQKFGAERADDIVGKSDADFFDEEHAHAAREDERRVMETQEAVLGKVEHETWPDGRSSWCSTTKLPLKDDHGRVIGTFGVTRDVTQLVAAEQALARERDLLRTLMDHLPDLIYVKDANGRYVLVNEAVRQLLGIHSDHDIQGKTSSDFLPPEQAQLEQTDDQQVLSTGIPLIEREERMTDPDGSVRWVLTSKVPLTDDAGNVTGLVGIDRNITRLKQGEHELRTAKETADAANRAKSDFLANVSHEIRTPMNAIIGMTDLLLETNLSDSQREYLTMVQQSGESLLSLINDILDYSKIEAGKLELDAYPFDVREGIGDTMKSLALRAHGKGLELAFHIDTAIPQTLHGDLGRLRQILVNLVGNAIKFTDTGEVVLEVGIGQRQDARIELSFQVRDTGIGIPEEKRARIFDEFEQADNSITRRFGGTGLGLAISSRLVRLMHGAIQVDSEPGQGSVFSFQAWFDVVDAPVGTAPPSRRLVISEAGVLVVDDNATNRRILREMLSNWGMRPSLAEDADEALRILMASHRAGQPLPLVVSDVNMPGMDGFSLVEKINEQRTLPRPAMILLTSGVRVEDSARWKHLGVSAHLMKPIKQSELFEAVVTALNLVVPDKPERLLASDRAKGRIRSLRVLLAEDNIVNQKLATAALSGLGHRVEIAHNGRQAVELSDRGSFDIVLMDLQMPEMDGLTATRTIREEEENGTRSGRQLIVAMTAHAMKGDREMCLQAGMDDYLPKPIRIQDLSDLIRRHFEAGEAIPAAVEANEPATGMVNWKRALEHVNGNQPLLRDVVQAFVDDVPRLLQEARDALAQQDRDALQRSVHGLKGSMLFLEAQAPIEIAQDLENRAASESFSQLAPVLQALDENAQRLLDELNARLAGDPSWQEC